MKKREYEIYLFNSEGVGHLIGRTEYKRFALRNYLKSHTKGQVHAIYAIDNTGDRRFIACGRNTDFPRLV